jgi:Zn-finger nucleic acid-binding protein
VVLSNIPDFYPRACASCGFLIYHFSVANKSNFDLTCPCCGAVLKVDAESEAVISHVAPVKPKTFNDLDEAARALKEQDSRRDSIFRQSVEAQKHASDLLEKKFQEALRKAKESPDTGKPIRDFDLD